MSPRAILISSSFSLFALAACSDPQCPDEFTKVGKVCKRIPADASTADQDAESVAAAGDASGADAGAADANAPSFDASSPLGCPGVCSTGEVVSCTSSCGSTGTAICSTECAVPGPESCKAPSETCNWIDDDCDGQTDPSLVVQKSAATRVWTQAGAPDAYGAAVALIARPGGGSWWLYRDGDFNTARPIQLAQFDPSGATTPMGTVPQSDDSLLFRTASHDAWAGIAIRGSQGQISVRLHRTSDFAYIDQYDMYRPGPCETLSVRGFDIFEANKKVRVAVQVAVFSTLNASTGACDLSTLSSSLRSTFVSWDTNSRTWGSLKKLPPSDADGPLTALPCDDMWLQAAREGTSTDSPWRLQVRTADGDLSNVVLPLPDVKLVESLTTIRATCADGASRILGITSSAPFDSQNLKNYIPRLEEWSVSAARIERTRMPKELGAPVLGTSLLSLDDRIFAAGLEGSGALRVIELPTSGSRRGVSVMSLEEPSVSATNGLGASGFSSIIGNSRSVGIAAAGSAIIVATGRSYPTTTLTPHRSLGDQQPAVAVTYVLGCSGQ